MAVKEQPHGALTRGAQVSIFMNVVVICALATLLAFVIVFVVGRISFNHSLRADLTRDHRFTIDPLAQSIVRKLPVPVSVTFVFGFDAEIKKRTLDLAGQPRENLLLEQYRPILLQVAGRVTTVLTEWSKLSENVRVDIVDAEMEPVRVKEVAERQHRPMSDLIRGMNQVVLRAGDRERTVPINRIARIQWGNFPPDPRWPAVPPEILGDWRVQTELTDALRGVAAGESVKVGVPRGASAVFGPESKEFEALTRILKSQGFEPVPVELNRGVPPEVSLVLLPGVGKLLGVEETEALKRFEASGGRLLICCDPRLPEGYRRVLERYGVRVVDGEVEDPSRMYPNQTNAAQLISADFCVGTHEIDRPLEGRIGIHLGLTRPIEIENLTAEGGVRVALLRASSDSKTVPVEFKSETGAPDFIENAKKATPNAILAVALERPSSTSQKARVVVVGSSDVMNPTKLALGTHYGNRDFILNALNWLVDRNATIGVVEAEVAGSQVELSPELLSTFRLAALGGFPLVLAVIGIAVWLRRRN